MSKRRLFHELIVAALAAVAMVGCGSSKDGGKDGDEDTTFECYSQQGKCTLGKEYCLVSKQGNIEVSGMCANLPAGCSSCDCAPDNAEAAWKAANDNSNNCTGAMLLCNESDRAITVTCSK